MKSVLFTTLCCFMFFVFGCKSLELIKDDAEIQKRVHDELNQSATSGNLMKFAEKNKIKGEFVFDVTVYKKGQVLTITPVGNSTDNIKHQNLLKDYLKEFRFNFKLQSGKKLKVNHIFNF